LLTFESFVAVFTIEHLATSTVMASRDFEVVREIEKFRQQHDRRLAEEAFQLVESCEFILT
jgi:hypothetical protein